MIDAEAEAELRRWRPMPNGGHDPEALSVWERDLARDGLQEVLPGNISKNGGNAEGANK